MVWIVQGGVVYKTEDTKLSRFVWQAASLRGRENAWAMRGMHASLQGAHAFCLDLWHNQGHEKLGLVSVMVSPQILKSTLRTRGEFRLRNTSQRLEEFHANPVATTMVRVGIVSWRG